MKRLRPPAVLVLLVALVAFAPMGAQTPTKRAFDLEDILAFRAIAVTTLSTNGQWLAYRLAPLQGPCQAARRPRSSRRWRWPATPLIEKESHAAGQFLASVLPVSFGFVKQKSFAFYQDTRLLYL